jgi:dipeptidyl-peptidase-4
MRQGGAGITSYASDRDVRRVVVTLSGRLFVLDVATGEATEVPTAGPAVDPRLSPDGAWVAYHSDGGLHVAPASGEETGRALAADESPAVSWGLSDFAHAEELHRLRAFWWAPDSSGLLVARVDESDVPPVYIADPAHPDQPPASVSYPFAGAANPHTSLWFVTLDGRRDEITWDSDAFCYLADVSWTQGRPALVTVLDRRQRHMRIYSWLPGSAPVMVRSLADDHWVDVLPGVPTWWGERLLTVEPDAASDTSSLCADGEPLSPPGMQVRAVLDVLDDRVLLAVAEDEREQRVAWLDSDGRWQLATEGGAVATARSAGGTTVTRRDRPISVVPTLTVTTARGEAALRVDVVDPGVVPQPVFLPRSSPEDPRVAVLMPSAPAPRPLPVLLDPYGGPHVQRVVHTARAYLESQWWADQGYVVVVADGPGTPGSPAWERAMSGDLAEPALAAQVRALEMVADAVGEQADLSRVGIRGWSFGGYLAALAVLERPDLVHAGIAGAPVTDWALYDTAYTERYLGLPGDQPDRYASQSLPERADRLSRPLLVIHGLADDNVLVANTLRLSSALLAAGRPHQVLPLSGVTHMTPQEVVAENLLLAQRDFLAQALSP